jgi:hypothetical protein
MQAVVQGGVPGCNGTDVLFLLPQDGQVVKLVAVLFGKYRVQTANSQFFSVKRAQIIGCKKLLRYTQIQII